MNIRELSQEEADEKLYPLINGAFADTFGYPTFETRTDLETQQFPKLRDNFRRREFIFLGAFSDTDELMGFSISYQMRNYELYTQTSVVLPEHRRKGIYTALTKMNLKLAGEKGYQMVTSNHVASNNSVIMAKLKLGFYISGFELVDDFGALVKLTHFLNEKRERMYHVRTSLKRPEQDLKDLLKL